MRKEIEKLYNDWYWSYAISAFLSKDIVNNDYFWKLVDYCKEHKGEALKFIEEKLDNGYSHICMVMPYITIDENMIDEYFETIGDKLTLEQSCNTWLNYLKNTEGVDYYIEYRCYEKYLNDNYIVWDPRIEDDPNITFQEFKKGLRNINETTKDYETEHIEKERS